MFRYGEMYERRDEIQKKPYLGKMRPFKIVGNVYFAGTYQASCHLIDTGEGLILIDPGYENTAYLVINSIYELGFKPRDVKYIVNTHWHDDHIGATAAFADLTGARTLLGREDVERAASFFTPDIIVDDGYELTLGNTKMTFLHTPGHTAGTISPFFTTEEDGKVYRVGMFGGAGLNTLGKGTFEFEGCREAYLKSIERLKDEKVDVFIGNHTWNNDTYEKALKLFETGENDFIDSDIWVEFLTLYQKRLEKMIKDGQ